MAEEDDTEAQGTLLPSTLPAAFARVVDSQNRIIGLHPLPDGRLTLSFETGRGLAERELDRFQAGALRAAFAALPEG